VRGAGTAVRRARAAVDQMMGVSECRFAGSKDPAYICSACQPTNLPACRPKPAACNQL
jgi:hypothetical protein